MLEIGTLAGSSQRVVNRRGLLRISASLPLLFADRTLRSAEPSQARAKAKSVILLWMWGGPSQLDTFDPKPNAASEVRGPFASITTRTTGMRFSELFPRLADRSNMFSVVRSHINHDSAHHIAGSIALCGGKGANGDNDYDPNFGSIVQRVRRGQSKLPPFISVGSGQPDTAAGKLKAYGGGVWGSAYDPFPVRCTELNGVQLPTLRLLDGLNSERLQDRRTLASKFDRLRRAGEHSELDRWSTNSQRAFRMLTSPQGRLAFDLSRENAKTRGRFGRTQFGQSCLLARRLVEAEVPYVQVNWSKYVENIYDRRTDFGWDTHWLNFEHMADRHGPIFDRAASALLDDLEQRGLLDSTLVVAMGEFGRTPRISANGGRDHWPRCYSSIWAGGGVQAGRVIGESDKTASDPVTQPITPDMVGTTMLELTGIRIEQRAQLRVLPTGRVIDALL